VMDGRQVKGLTLDDAAFELTDCPTALSTEDFYQIAKGDGELKEKYYKEVEEFAKKRLGCDKVKCFNHVLRSQEKKKEKQGKYDGYASSGPHVDSSAVSADIQALDINKGDDTKYKRFLYVNLWRNISEHPIEDNHLACMDERSAVKPEDYIPRELFGDGFTVTQYKLNARHADSHKWYYYPKMRKDEAILLKQYDSDWTKSGRVCFHFAVKDSTLPKDVVPRVRESIEVRMMCYWREAEVDSMPTEQNTNRSMIHDPKAIAKLSGGESLADASIFSLAKAMFMATFGPCIPGLRQKRISNNKTAKYSGNPKDYVERFTKAVSKFPHWPGWAKDWAKGHMSKLGRKAGVEEITTKMVKDKGGHHGCTHFTSDQHAEIVKALFESADYDRACAAHFAPLASKD